MIKLIIVGLWSVVLTAASAAAVIELGLLEKFLTPKQQVTEKIETINTPEISVPVMSGGDVLGYVIARFAVTVKIDSKMSASGRVVDLIADEAFKVIYNISEAEAREARKADLAQLVNAIRDGLNKRERPDFVSEVLLKGWIYLKKEDARK